MENILLKPYMKKKSLAARSLSIGSLILFLLINHYLRDNLKFFNKVGFENVFKIGDEFYEKNLSRFQTN